jgi:hypothetical protein
MEYRYRYRDTVIIVEAPDEAEAHVALAEIVARDWPETALDDWDDD